MTPSKLRTRALLLLFRVLNLGFAIDLALKDFDGVHIFYIAVLRFG